MEGSDAALAEQIAGGAPGVPEPDEAVPVAADNIGDEAAAPPSGGLLPSMPDVTKAQLIGLVPIAAKFGTAFGLYHLSPAEQESLTEVVGAGVVLIAADAVIRHGRATLVKVLAKGRGV